MIKIWSFFRFLGKVDEKATQLHAIASLKVLLDATKPQDGVNGTAAGMEGMTSDMGPDGTTKTTPGGEVIRREPAEFHTSISFSMFWLKSR